MIDLSVGGAKIITCERFAAGADRTAEGVRRIPGHRRTQVLPGTLALLARYLARMRNLHGRDGCLESSE